MSEAETVRLVGEVLGVLGIFAATFWRLAIHIRNWAQKILTAQERHDRRLDEQDQKFAEGLQGVTNRLDKVNGNITRLSDAERELRERQAWLAGKLGEEEPRQHK